MAVELQMPDISMPDVSKLEIPVKMEKARQSLSGARDSMRDTVRETMRDRLADNLPRREAPSPWPFVVGGLLAGVTIGYFLATSDWFGPRVKGAVDEARNRIGQMRSGSDEDELGAGLEYAEVSISTTDTAPVNDPFAPEQQNEQSYAI